MARGWLSVPQFGMYVFAAAVIAFTAVSGRYLFFTTQFLEAQATSIVQDIPAPTSVNRENIWDYSADHFKAQAAVDSASAEYERALQNLNYAIAVDPDDVVTYLNRADLYVTLGLLPLAANDYEVAIHLSPDVASFGPYFYELGNEAYRLELNQLAVKYFARAASFDIKDARYYYSLARTYEAMDEVDKALATYEQVILLDPELGYEVMLDWAIRAQTTYNYDQSLPYFDRAIATLPQRDEAYRYRAVSYYYLGYKEQSFADLLQALQLAPEKPVVYQAIGWYYDQEGDAYMASLYQQRAKELETAS